MTGFRFAGKQFFPYSIEIGSEGPGGDSGFEPKPGQGLIGMASKLFGIQHETKCERGVSSVRVATFRGMWHIGVMQKSKLPRCPYVPFTVLDYGNLPVFNVSGECWGIISREFAPSADESCETLVAMRTNLKWSRAMLAAFMGISRQTVRRWETKERKPSGAAKRLIWLMETLTRHPERLKSGLDLPLWGQSDELLEYARKVGMFQDDSESDSESYI